MFHILASKRIFVDEQVKPGEMEVCEYKHLTFWLNPAELLYVMSGTDRLY